MHLSVVRPSLTGNQISRGHNAMATLAKWLLLVKGATGLDGAIAYTALARSFQILGSVGMVLLIVRFLSPVEQGYYYALLSLTALQMVFELGFSTVILQMAAHEVVHLNLNQNSIVDQHSVAYGRLASVLQKTVRWYVVAGSLMLLTLIPIGRLFFYRLSPTAHGVSWEGPWRFAAIACVGGFVMNPMYSFLEGCGQIRPVAKMRLIQVLVGIALGWAAMLTHRGLYSPGIAMMAATAIGVPMLWTRRRLILPLWRFRSSHHNVDWWDEVWPFQWKIAITSLCTYFTSQLFTLILFAFKGPQEAGRLGMSLSITFYLNSLVGPWMSTKAPTFGGMAAQKQFHELDSLFFRTLRQSVVIFVLVAATWEVCLFGISRIAPSLGARMVSPLVFALFFATIISTHIVQSEGIYLRAFKREPFLGQSTIIALATVAASMLTAKQLGIYGISLSYFFCTGVMGLLFATHIFRTRRKAYALNEWTISRSLLVE